MRARTIRVYVFSCLLLCACLYLPADAQAAKQDRLTLQPLAEAVTVRLGSVKSAPHTLPLITWGGDIGTVTAEMEGYFRSARLDVNLVREDNFAKQVENCLRGRTPFLRGTMGMINAAAPVFKQAGTELVVFHNMTRSTGGDCIVVRDSIKKPKDFKGKTIALQLYGPHMDYIANVLANAGVNLKDVNFVWFEDLTIPDTDRGSITDPVTAFRDDAGIDAVCCIIPDGLELTSGGQTGTGAEGSIKGAKILLSTATATHVIFDVYAVRKDYYDGHETQIQKLAHVLLEGQEKLAAIVADRQSDQAAYNAVMQQSSDLVWGVPGDLANTEALLGDCTYVHYNGQLEFLQGKGTTRNLRTLVEEIQASYLAMGLIDARAPVTAAALDFGALAGGLRLATGAPAAKPRFDQTRVQQKVEQMIAVEPTSWEEEGTLFVIEINFEPNQSAFSSQQYATDYQKALEIAQTFGGALVVVEGHSDPLGVLRARKDGKSKVEIREMEQVAKNLSVQRANAVRGSFIDYCQGHGFTVDESQFAAVGLGIKAPKFNPPRTKEEWSANRRVVFRIKQVEAELTEFVPLD